jgi:hypothetical protein
MSKWDEWKRAVGTTRPWHLLDHSKLIEDTRISDERLDICKACPFYLKATTQCKKCGCVMPLKVRLETAVCPEGKW